MATKPKYLPRYLAPGDKWEVIHLRLPMSFVRRWNLWCKLEHRRRADQFLYVMEQSMPPELEFTAEYSAAEPTEGKDQQ